MREELRRLGAHLERLDPDKRELVEELLDSLPSLTPRLRSGLLLGRVPVSASVTDVGGSTLRWIRSWRGVLKGFPRLVLGSRTGRGGVSVCIYVHLHLVQMCAHERETYG